VLPEYILGRKGSKLDHVKREKSFTLIVHLGVRFCFSLRCVSADPGSVSHVIIRSTTFSIVGLSVFSFAQQASINSHAPSLKDGTSDRGGRSPPQTRLMICMSFKPANGKAS
jgi:hypothetical protein